MEELPLGLLEAPDVEEEDGVVAPAGGLVSMGGAVLAGVEEDEALAGCQGSSDVSGAWAGPDAALESVEGGAGDGFSLGAAGSVEEGLAGADESTADWVVAHPLEGPKGSL